ncbi:right-handed parallel beta-helix repeat-containing protein [Mariniflexile maritimum]|uniref:right-handed parallel beta-helix repeat-containing protein n=1 Tax=Mariniflexile maritimum TaxID=2682493 RepID=UPI0012F69A6A|nr:right-handed parallel beta-helix repeat-containing protein [Mariniflexile maritimum]
MKKFTFLIILFAGIQTFATDYYFSFKTGKDTNNGTSIKTPFKNLSIIKNLKLKAGDCVFLKKGETFSGSIELLGVAGERDKPILISSYGNGTKKPIVDAKGRFNGILIQDCSNIKISNIEITANGGGIEGYVEGKNYLRCGILITALQDGVFENMILENLYVRDIFLEQEGFNRGAEEVLTGNGNQNYGWGIRVINSNEKALLKDITISKCLVDNVAHSGIRFTGNHGLSTSHEKNIKNVKVYDNHVIRAGGPAMQASVVDNIHFKGNTTNFSGSADDSRKWGRGSGLWVWGCLNAVIEHNIFRNANGPGDSAGCHIDFNNKNVIVQYNLSENNAGGFIEVLGNNYNCTYRYNVSINDGSRLDIKGKTLGAGVTMILTGFVGFDKNPIGPFNTYLYNNTIYVKEGINPEIGFNRLTDGVLIANNIFYIEGKLIEDHRVPFRLENGPIKNVVFKNNLYLNANIWPTGAMITDISPLYGNPEFKNLGGLEIEDYIPQNIELIKNKGIEITNIPGDTIGINGGLKVKTDILGNKISGLPDMGAIEVQ